jgi:hypothetical protein
MALEYVIRTLVAAQYTGQASAAAVAEAAEQITQYTGNTWTVQSDDGSVLVLRETNPTNGAYADWPVLAGQVVVVDPSIGIVDRLSVNAFLARYRRATTVADETLVRGLNTPAWITALKTKLGIAAAKV